MFGVKKQISDGLRAGMVSIEYKRELGDLLG